MLDLTDPSLWLTPDVHLQIAELRRTTPVFQHDTHSDGPIWSVLSYEACQRVLGEPGTFSSRDGSLLGTGFAATPSGSGKMMALSDPPTHRKLRAPTAPLFTTGQTEKLRPRIDALTAQVVSEAVQAGEVDLVRKVCAHVPMTVACELIGVESSDRDAVVALCDTAFLGSTPESRRQAHQQLLSYLFDLAIDRRTSPRDDLISRLVTGLDEPDGLQKVVLNCDNILVGGVQTVRHTAAVSVQTLIDHQPVWRELSTAATPLPDAVEELLRWTSVGQHVLRTALHPVDLAGCHIDAGERVVAWIPAANRDEAVFDRPQEINLRRRPNRHIAFGWGVHYCIGAPLARAELSALLAELIRQVGLIEPTGEPVPNRSIINFGYDHLPVRLVPRDPARP